MLLFTVTGGEDVTLGVEHDGVLSESRLVGGEEAVSLEVTGTGTFQATATGEGRVGLSVKER